MPRRSAFLITLCLLAATLAIYALSPATSSYDSRWSLHTSLSFAQGRWGDLSDYRDSIEKLKNYAVEYRDGKPRNWFPIGASLLAIPGVVIVDWADPSFRTRLHEGLTSRTEKLFASAIAAAAVTVFFWLIYSQFFSIGIALGSTVIFAFGTSMWSTASRALWQHGPLVLMLTIAMLLLQRSRDRPSLVQYVSLPLAFALISRPTAGVAVLALSAYVALCHRRWLTRYLGWSALIAVPWLAYNFVIYGGPFPSYYLQNLSTDHSLLEGMLGNLVSPSRGLLVFSPVLILSISGFAAAMRDRERRLLYGAYALIVLITLFIIGKSSMWWAGHSFGPRFTTDLVPFLAFFVPFNVYYFENWQGRARTVAFACAGVLFAISAAIHGNGAIRGAPMAWNVFPQNIDENPARAWDWSDPQFAR